MNDYILISQLDITMHIGVHEWEKHTTQTLQLDIKMFLDIQSRSDNIEHTVCYQKVTEHLREVLTAKHIELIETVADITAHELLTHYPLKAVEVLVKKSHAITNCQYVAVGIFRQRLTGA
jgi:dihydroneopterin aldolase